MAVAQTEEEPVRWTTSIDRISKDAVVLQFDATIAEKWHLYSLEEFTDGPLPTEFTFVFDSLKIQLDGETTSGTCLLYTSPSPRDRSLSRMPSSA